MPGLRLFTSNRMEILAGQLAEILSKPLASPLAAEIIVVQSRGMERWVSMELARRLDICANVRFPFPNAFVREVFPGVLPDIPESPAFDPKIMTWEIMRLLPSCLNRPGFEGLKSYCEDTSCDLKIFQLSERIADVFDQYLLFRPGMIFRWEKGHENHWQAVLFRELVKVNGKWHRAALGKAFIEATEKPSSGIGRLPERISVFGISALPRFHMQILASLGRCIHVNLFLLNPCREYWGDIVSEWQIIKSTMGNRREDLTPEELHLEEGNRLLGSIGTLGREFFDLVHEFDCEESQSFEDPGEDSLLSTVQSHILNLKQVRQDPAGKRVVRIEDTSIQVQSCHGPMREMEILHDQLLNMFEDDPKLRPGDILVMTPNIESYSPFIHAVFDLPANDAKRIPFSIADRNARNESKIIDAFLSILELNGSRFSASQVIGILESSAVRGRFGLFEEDLDRVRRWVDDAGIRWGIDGEGRAGLGLPSLSENTWKAGLERLLLGYALPGQDENIFCDILPYDDIEGGEARVLGKFAEFTERLFAQVKSLTGARTLSEWSKTLTGLLGSFFMPDEDSEREMQVIRCMLNNLSEMEDLSGFDKKVDLKVIKWHLGRSLEKEGFGFGFMTGGITFCAMLPMRSVPFEIICLVGMNNDAYPRQSKPLGFDLVAKNPQPGDRSRRNDDRYLFLEVLLSARKKLYISYVGQSIQDNTPIPPSVLVSELLDYIEQCFMIRDADILDRIVTRHRLQAFSPEYFKNDGRFFSYSRENLRAARWFLGPRRAAVPFFSRELSEPGPEWRTISLDDLCRFFQNPARFLLNRRLGIYLSENTLVLKEKEAFDVRGLDKYLLEEDFLKKRLSGFELRDIMPLMRAAGRLPHGTVGECLLEGLSHRVEDFAGRIAFYINETALDPLEVELDIAGFRLTGRIHSIYPKGLVQYRYAKARPEDHLRVWIYHLAMNCLMADQYPQSSIIAGLTSKGRELDWAVWEYPPVEKSEGILENLLRIYWAGLVSPLHFFPKSSWKYIQTVRVKGKSEETALSKAANIWTGEDHRRGESEDAYYNLCFRHSDPLDKQFQGISEDVLGPLWAVGNSPSPSAKGYG
ncbi:MAG: exodeoxyribonuclease V subunit gamma [Thermodesulfobacteriota bacterium]|nr:exodeoxyribonuclease V subunit gamma [Thermodesulfobacteriota bacterium]